jgi:hypothetical protein
MKHKETNFSAVYTPQQFVASGRIFKTQPIFLNYKIKPEFCSDTARRTYLDKVRQNLAGLSKEFIGALNKISSVKQMYAFLYTNLYCLSPSLAKKLLIIVHF